MIKKLFELLGLVVVIGEYYILYCVGAACWYGEPFPPFALTLARLYAYGFCAALVIGAVLLALAMTHTVIGGLGNIADQYQGIVMFGKAELANLNYAMFGIYLVSIIAAIGACFSKKSK
jgi:hypothetical protein